MHYEQLRHFADSWGLLAMAVVFAGAILWALRPGGRRKYDRQADIPFKYDAKD